MNIADIYNKVNKGVKVFCPYFDYYSSLSLSPYIYIEREREGEGEGEGEKTDRE